MARAVAEYEKQHMAAVDAAWQAACAAAKPAEGQEEAAAKPLAPVDSQATTTGSASSADRPNNAAARSSASSLWDMSTPPPRKEPMDNPFLAGLPGKPRCIKCTMLLDKGLCLEPDRTMF